MRKIDRAWIDEQFEAFLCNLMVKTFKNLSKRISSLIYQIPKGIRVSDVQAKTF